MGYTTEFEGQFEFDQPLNEEQRSYINTFSLTRRMKRDSEKLKSMYGGKYGLNGQYGEDGEFFAKDDGNFGQTKDESIIDSNTPPGQLLYNVKGKSFEEIWDANEKLIKEGKCQPSLWCQWVVTEDGRHLEWDGGEKFYLYVDWLKYMIEKFFKPWGRILNGEVKFQGQSIGDNGWIIIKNNNVKVQRPAFWAVI